MKAFKAACLIHEMQHTEQLILIVFVFLPEVGWVLESAIGVGTYMQLSP